MDEAAIWAEYERLGYDRGWAFAMTPYAWLHEAKTVLVGLNPGGADGEHDGTDGCWESQNGNEYFTAAWSHPIRGQVMKLHDLLGLGAEDVFAAQFIPFRSPSLAKLPSLNEALAFAREKLWRPTLALSPANLFICMGGFTAWHIADLLGAKLEVEIPCGYGRLKVRRYVNASGKVVVGIPHPSRYQLLSLHDVGKAMMAREAIKAAARRLNGQQEV